MRTAEKRLRESREDKDWRKKKIGKEKKGWVLERKVHMKSRERKQVDHAERKKIDKDRTPRKLANDKRKR